MEIMEIIINSISYPAQHLKSLVIYFALGLIGGIIIGLSGARTAFAAGHGSFFTFFVAIIGLIIAVIIGFVIEGYGLDIIKFGIRRLNASPEVEFERQSINGIKSLVVFIVYYIIPIIIMFLLSFIFRDWILFILGFVLFIIFSLAFAMGQCRLAKTDDLSNALDISAAIDDIFNIGIAKVILTIIAISIVILVITGIFSAITNFIFGTAVASAIMGIIDAYVLFFANRALGLLYSEI